MDRGELCSELPSKFAIGGGGGGGGLTPTALGLVNWGGGGMLLGKIFKFKPFEI